MRPFHRLNKLSAYIGTYIHFQRILRVRILRKFESALRVLLVSVAYISENDRDGERFQRDLGGPENGILNWNNRISGDSRNEVGIENISLMT